MFLAKTHVFRLSLQSMVNGDTGEVVRLSESPVSKEMNDFVS